MVKTHAQPYKHIIHVYTYMFNTTKDSQDQLLYKCSLYHECRSTTHTETYSAIRT